MGEEKKERESERGEDERKIVLVITTCRILSALISRLENWNVCSDSQYSTFFFLFVPSIM